MSQGLHKMPDSAEYEAVIEHAFPSLMMIYRIGTNRDIHVYIAL